MTRTCALWCLVWLVLLALLTDASTVKHELPPTDHPLPHITEPYSTIVMLDIGHKGASVSYREFKTSAGLRLDGYRMPATDRLVWDANSREAFLLQQPTIAAWAEDRTPTCTSLMAWKDPKSFASAIDAHSSLAFLPYGSVFNMLRVHHIEYSGAKMLDNSTGDMLHSWTLQAMWEASELPPSDIDWLAGRLPLDMNAITYDIEFIERANVESTDKGTPRFVPSHLRLRTTLLHDPRKNIDVSFYWFGWSTHLDDNAFSHPAVAGCGAAEKYWRAEFRESFPSTAYSHIKSSEYKIPGEIFFAQVRLQSKKLKGPKEFEATTFDNNFVQSPSQAMNPQSRAYDGDIRNSLQAVEGFEVIVPCENTLFGPTFARPVGASDFAAMDAPCHFHANSNATERGRINRHSLRRIRGGIALQHLKTFHPKPYGDPMLTTGAAQELRGGQVGSISAGSAWTTTNKQFHGLDGVYYLVSKIQTFLYPSGWHHLTNFGQQSQIEGSPAVIRRIVIEGTYDATARGQPFKSEFHEFTDVYDIFPYQFLADASMDSHCVEHQARSFSVGEHFQSPFYVGFAERMSAQQAAHDLEATQVVPIETTVQAVQHASLPTIVRESALALSDGRQYWAPSGALQVAMIAIIGVVVISLSGVVARRVFQELADRKLSAQLDQLLQEDSRRRQADCQHDEREFSNATMLDFDPSSLVVIDGSSDNAPQGVCALVCRADHRAFAGKSFALKITLNDDHADSSLSLQNRYERELRNYLPYSRHIVPIFGRFSVVLHDAPRLHELYAARRRSMPSLAVDPRRTAVAVMPLYRCSLKTAIHVQNQAGLTADFALRVVLQILLAVDHMVQGSLLHMDLKPANVLLHPTVGDNIYDKPLVVVSDFGVCLAVENIRSFPLAQMAGHAGGSRYHRAPELKADIVHGPVATIDASRAEVYSAGLILTEICERLDNAHAAEARAVNNVARLCQAEFALRPTVREAIVLSQCLLFIPLDVTRNQSSKALQRWWRAVCNTADVRLDRDRAEFEPLLLEFVARFDARHVSRVLARWWNAVVA